MSHICRLAYSKICIAPNQPPTIHQPLAPVRSPIDYYEENGKNGMSITRGEKFFMMLSLCKWDIDLLDM